MCLVERGRKHELVAAQRIHRGLPQKVATKVSIVVQEWAVRVIAFPGEQCSNLVLRRRQHQQVALRVELSTGQLNDSFLDGLPRSEIDRSCRGEVAVLGEVGPFVDVEAFNRLRDDKVQIGVALPVGMRTEIDRHAVRKERHVGAVIGIKAPEEILIGLPGPAGVLHRDEPGNQPQDLGGAPLGLKKIFFVGNELLRRGRDGTVAYHGHFGQIDDFNIRVMRVGGGGQPEKQGADNTDDHDPTFSSTGTWASQRAHDRLNRLCAADADPRVAMTKKPTPLGRAGRRRPAHGPRQAKRRSATRAIRHPSPRFQPERD